MSCDIILLVEDNADDVKQMLRAFERNAIGNEVVVVRDGAEALDYLYGTGRFRGRDTTEQPGLILLDLKLPRVPGLEVLERLRADPRTLHVPVVVLTSSSEDCDMMRSYSLGANIFVRKPVRVTGFLQAARNLGLYWSLLESGLALLHREPSGASSATDPTPRERTPPPDAGPWPMDVLVVGGVETYRSLRDLLLPQGHLVAHAEGAKAAFAILRTNLPDVMVVENALPDIGGAEVIRALRRSVQGERVTTVLLAADPDRMRKDLADDAVHVVPSPIDTRWFQALMREVCAERRRSLWPACDASEPPGPAAASLK